MTTPTPTGGTSPFPCDHCPAPCEVVDPGADDVREVGILLRRGRPIRRWCAPCARAAGWPWVRGEGVAA